MARDLMSSDGSESEDGGGDVQSSDLRVNESFARRFEHNKKREELQRLQEKLGKTSRKRKRDDEAGSEDDSTDESTSESEDEGELVTEVLDSEIVATINAIRSKDPRVYDPSAKFYSETSESQQGDSRRKKEKPMHLQDYHRQNLLNGNADAGETEDAPLTYNQEQEQLKKSIIGEINATAEESESDDEEEDATIDDKFLVAKHREKPAKQQQVKLDVDNADKDPETYLSNFMVSRAWVAANLNLHPFESDDDEEDKRAEEFEEAYNLRFEDPAKSNEKLRSHARDVAAKYSVRRDEANPRQKKREAEKAVKEAEKQQRKEEKARLRKLKIEQLEEKVRKIKRAAGVSTKDIQPEDWSHFVDDEWDDARWEQEMQKRFGDDYYAQQDVGTEEETTEGKSKVRKPKFDDDIDIKDIIPEFEAEEKAEFSLTDEDQPAKKKKKANKMKDDKKRDAKKERRIIEQLVDDQLQMELESSLPQKTAFRYRESSPKSFGLSARDILLADDKQLNEFAGLKKLASFRDAEKKRKDQKHLGKKARLRKWRLDTFGNEEGLQASELIPSKSEERTEPDGQNDASNIITKGKKKRRRSKKNKVEAVDEA
ncbi:KRI1-like family C-terminal-domain-containing protein [Exophiala viscosa]|uniref:KRI1-like family C-terminal-domain-containing protein n=1 Tax=Exophiala viscosa TaxID=2486360 RepID=UPI00218F47BA|nr:KRI1-like family C-terminal-domain-containing protein [Exophiala viscosa]